MWNHCSQKGQISQDLDSVAGETINVSKYMFTLRQEARLVLLVDPMCVDTLVSDTSVLEH